MRDTILTVRLPHSTRALIRALSAVTGCSVQEVIVTALERFYARLPRSMKQQVTQLGQPQARHRA